MVVLQTRVANIGRLQGKFCLLLYMHAVTFPMFVRLVCVFGESDSSAVGRLCEKGFV